MRFATIAALLALIACKDKPASKPVEKKPATEITSRPSLQNVDVQGTGTLPAANLGPKVVIDPQEISIDGEPVLSIAGDAPVGRRELETLTTRLETKVKGDEPVALSLDPAMPFYRFAGIFDALHKAGFHKLALLTSNGTKMIPLDRIDAAEANRGGTAPTVTIKHGRLTLWDGKEQKLAYDLTDGATFQPLTHALADIVQTRWPNGNRTDEDRRIIIQVDNGTTAQVLLGLLAAVRVEGTLTLFPSIFLAGSA